MCDVCGAWDTVLATLGLVIATGGTIGEGRRQSVRMAAEQVGRVGGGGVGYQRKVI